THHGRRPVDLARGHQRLQFELNSSSRAPTRPGVRTDAGRGRGFRVHPVRVLRAVCTALVYLVGPVLPPTTPTTPATPLTVQGETVDDRGKGVVRIGSFPSIRIARTAASTHRILTPVGRRLCSPSLAAASGPPE